MGIDFFSSAMYPVFQGIPLNQTVPIFITDFNTPGMYSALRWLRLGAFPGGAEYLKNYAKADRVAVLYADNAPGQQCYTDTQERFYKFLNLPEQGFKDSVGDPSDNDANVQAILKYLDGAQKGAIYFGIQASDCAEYTKAFAKAGNKNLLVESGSCLDESVTSDPSSKGAILRVPGLRPEPGQRATARSPSGSCTAREQAIKDYGPKSPLSTFMRTGFAALVWDYQILNDFVAAGGDPKDAAAVIKAFQAAENSPRRRLPADQLQRQRPAVPVGLQEERQLLRDVGRVEVHCRSSHRRGQVHRPHRAAHLDPAQGELS